MANRLMHELSPFLIRHSTSPIDWQPWSASALAEAADRRCPILLCIGGGRDAPVDSSHAGVANTHFVCILVDRSERPDVASAFEGFAPPTDGPDHHGAQTLVLTPSRVPFYRLPGRPPTDASPAGSLSHALQLWQGDRAEVQARAQDLRASRRAEQTPPEWTSAPSDGCRRVAETVLGTAADLREAPSTLPRPQADDTDARAKLPGPATMEALLLDWYMRRNPKVATRIEHLLNGSLHERRSEVTTGAPVSGSGGHIAPSQTRRLEDDAHLAVLLLQAAIALDRPDFASRAADIGDFARERLRLPLGGPATAFRADLGTPAGAALDDRVFAAHAATMVRAWCQMAAILEAPRFLECAVEAAAFIEAHLVHHGRLHRVWRAGRAGIPAFADDHAEVIRMSTALFQVTGDLRWLDQAHHWAEQLLERFRDPATGGLTLHAVGSNSGATPTPGLSRTLASPSAAVALAQLGTLTGRPGYAEAADAQLRVEQSAGFRGLDRFAHAAVATAWRTQTTIELAILGDPTHEETRAMRRVFHRRHLPLALVAPIAPDSLALARSRIPWLANRVPAKAGPKAYLCTGSACRLPTTTAKRLDAQLASLAPASV